ncbi:ADP-ribosylglycohydrolase family protein [Zhihengliuella halotolerans]|uniref:ADP-ribosylglycohydrolase n=1 Tax=Zhihengliuella halotolerans TaxID=370736 RepID=A0A4Q8AIN8_9MICC|nr:ADP-ribosylglycohydrolase family protein [Zhihengliuella halotolerans]RZU63703.1 ADP-ribosylglycohydrolase [Zhihengliuella halotolerans]
MQTAQFARYTDDRHGPDDGEDRWSQRDRAQGALVAAAAGDALGAGYEFGPPMGAGGSIAMIGGGPFGYAPGEWTDDTSMAVAIACELAAGHRLEAEGTLDRIVAAWHEWHLRAPSVGAQTRRVLGGLKEATAREAWESSHRLHIITGRSAGNGSLMRTAPLALAFLGTGQEEALATAARQLSQITHWSDDAGDACVLWCLAIRKAVLTGQLNLRDQLYWLPAERRDVWAKRIGVAEAKQPEDFPHNTWVVEAFQGAWSAIHHGFCLEDVLQRAVRGGNDTDTVAAIAGALSGAAHGASAVPAEWREALHGWPSLRAADLAELAVRILEGPPLPRQRVASE